MKIVNGPYFPTIRLSEIEPGDCVRFVTNLHSKHVVEDVFLRLHACSGYIPDKVRQKGHQVPVANLRTGELAYVAQQREVHRAVAELCVTQ